MKSITTVLRDDAECYAAWLCAGAVSAVQLSYIGRRSLVPPWVTLITSLSLPPGVDYVGRGVGVVDPDSIERVTILREGL